MSKLESDLLIKKCIIEPLEQLINTNSVKLNYFYVILDGLDIALQPNSTSLNNLGLFLFKNMSSFPKWFKFLITSRSEDSIKKHSAISKYYSISLDLNGAGSNSSARLRLSNNSSSSLSSSELGLNQNILASFLNKDLADYIAYRINKSLDIQKNILYFNCVNNAPSSTPQTVVTSSPVLANNASDYFALNSSDLCKSPQLNATTTPKSPNLIHIYASRASPTQSGTLNRYDSNFQHKFVQHLSSLSQHNYLFAKLTLDLIEKGSFSFKLN